MRVLILAMTLAMAAPVANAGGAAQRSRPSLVARTKAKVKRIQQRRAQRRTASRQKFHQNVATKLGSSKSVKDALVALTKHRSLKSKLGRQFHWGNGPGEIVLATRTISTQVYRTRVERVLGGRKTHHDLVKTKAEVTLVLGGKGIEIRASYPNLKQHESVAQAERESLTSMTPAGKVGIDKRLGLDVKVWGGSSRLADAHSISRVLADPMWKGLSVKDVSAAVGSWTNAR